MDICKRLRASGEIAAAGEILWGAALNALDDLAHESGKRHLGNMRARRDFVRRLTIVGSLAPSDWLQFRTGAVSLHNHFRYRRLADEDAIVHLDATFGLARRLVSLKYYSVAIQSRGEERTSRSL